MQRTRKSFSSADMSDAIGVRVAEFWRAALGRHAAKKLQDEFGIAQSTAEKILAGKRPENRLFDQMVLSRGRQFLDFVYRPIIPEPNRRLEEEISILQGIQDRLAAQLEERRNEISRALAHELAPEPIPALAGPGGSGAGEGRPAQGCRGPVE